MFARLLLPPLQLSVAMLFQKVSGKIGHHNQVAQFPVLIERVFSEKGFTLKAKFLEQVQGGELRHETRVAVHFDTRAIGQLLLLVARRFVGRRVR
jgi:hypothetical protein